MLQALLVDDSLGSLRTLRISLQKFCPQVEIVGEADNPETAYELMLIHKPNLILLDIEMPRGSGFDLIERAKDMEFEVIFTTAHEQYALEAIKHRAIDYVLKPIGHIHLMEAIKRAENRIKEWDKFRANNNPPINEGKSTGKKLPIPTTSGFEFINLDEIMYLEAEGIYTKLIIHRKKSVITTLRMAELEDKLANKGFFRIHRSFIINLDFIKQYNRGEGGYVVMDNGQQLSVARNRKETFLKWLDR